MARVWINGGNAIGMICSLSIPIITLCAFILLIIAISLLDIIFRWLPWFITCFRAPGLKRKRYDESCPKLKTPWRCCGSCCVAGCAMKMVSD